MRKAGLILLCAVLAVCLSACETAREYPGPLPLTTLEPLALEYGEETFVATLYCYGGSASRLIEETQEIELKPGENYATAALNALFERDALYSSREMTVQLERAELTGNLCIVHVTGQFPAETLRFLVARAAIAATVAKNQEGVEYTVIYWDGVQPGYQNRPMEPMGMISSTLSGYLAEVEASYNPLRYNPPTTLDPQVETMERRKVMLLFTDTTRSWLVGGVREISYPRTAVNAEIATLIVDELLKGPATTNTGKEPVLPAELALRAGSVRLVDDAGELLRTDEQAKEQPAIMELYFDLPEVEFEEELAYGALTYSIMSFCPNIKGLRIFINDQPAPQGEGAYFTMQDFAHLLGYSVSLCFPDADGTGLHTVARSLSQEQALNPLERLRALLQGSADPGVAYTGFTKDDIEGVYIQDDMAIVDWAPGFLEKLRDMIEDDSTSIPKISRESMFLYGVVNTLCFIPEVQRVWMLEDGACINEAASMIYLGSPLLKNPGLMLD